MIDQEELPEYIEKNIPELSGIFKKAHCRHAYDVVKHLFKYTSLQIREHNIKAAKECLALAAQLYKKGNSIVRSAIENVYVYSFSHAFFYDEHKRAELMPIVPASLYELYKKQVIYSHL